MMNILCVRTLARGAPVSWCVASVLLVGVSCKTRAFHEAKESAASTTHPNLQEAGCARHSDVLLRDRWKRETSEAKDVRFAVVGLNDLHGHVDVQSVVLQEEEKKRETKVGGLAAMAAYFEMICNEYKGNVLFLDAGDAYQGSLVSNLTQGKVVVEAFNALGIHASTFGNHEFDYGQDALVRLLSLPRSFHYVSANLRDAKNKAMLPWQQDRIGHLHKSALIKLNNVKVGVIGFTTLTTPLKTFPERVQGLAFVPPLARTGPDPDGVIATEARKLRNAGAQYVVLLGHAGGACDMKKPPEEGDSACLSEDDELSAFLRAMEEGTVDAAFGGHAHHAQRHFVNRTPLMQTTGHGLSFSWLEVVVSRSASAWSPRRERVLGEKLQDPVFFCHEHFEGYASCNPKEGEWGRAYGDGVFSGGSSSAPQFLGRRVDFQSPSANAAASSISEFLKAVGQKQEEVVASLPVRLDHDRIAESALGNCFTDAAKEALSANAKNNVNSPRVDVVVVNSGGIRAALPQGKLTYNDVYTALPFDNTFMAMEMSGRELLGFLRKIESSPEDLPYVSEPFSVRLTSSKKPPRVVSVYRNVKELGEGDRLVVGFSDFTRQFVEGVVGKKETERRIISTSLTMRDVFVERLRVEPLPQSCVKQLLGRHTVLVP